MMRYCRCRSLENADPQQPVCRGDPHFVLLFGSGQGVYQIGEV